LEEQGIFSELKRRRVFRVVGMYAVVSFVLLQIGDVAFEPLGLPAGSQRLLIVLLALGFPIVTILAWVFDITPAGIVRTDNEPEAAGSPAASSGATVDRLIIVGLIAVVIVLIWDPLMPWESSDPSSDALEEDPDISMETADASVAVLSFKSLSLAAEDAYFADGMAAEIQSVLTRIPDIRTVSGAGVLRGDGIQADLHAVGNRLGVAYLLEGSVRKSREDVRIMVQMVRVSDGRLVWSETYQQKVDDVFAIQDRIAETVAIRLQSTLYREGISARARARTENAEAYDRYLTALHYKPSDWDLVAEYAEKAVDADPGFGQAYALAARAYLTRLGGQIPAARAYPAARAAIDMALKLDPDDPESLLMLGHLERAAGNYAEAEHLYRSVKASSPNMVSTDLANLLQLLGRIEESLDEYERSRRLDPSSGGSFYAMTLVSAGRTNDALAWVEQELSIAQHSGFELYLRCFQALLLAEQGQGVSLEPLDELLQLVSLDEYSTLGFLAYTLARAGRTEEAERISRQLQLRSERNYVSPVANLYGVMGLGDHDRFFFWLNRCIDEQVLLVTTLVSASPLMDSFRDDPRFDAALDRMNLLSDT